MSTSTKTGFKPLWTNGHKDVDQHSTGIKTSSPSLKRFFLKGLHAAKAANKFADDPEFTISAYFFPNLLAKSFSKSLVFLDMVIWPETKTSIPAIKSSFEKALPNKG